MPWRRGPFCGLEKIVNVREVRCSRDDMSVKLRGRSKEGGSFIETHEGLAKAKPLRKQKPLITFPLRTGSMNKTSWIGITLLIYSIIVLIGVIAACPAEHASIPVSVFMILRGLTFFLLGKDLEKLSKGVEKAVAEKAKEAK
jgi:hypothetical protein